MKTVKLPTTRAGTSEKEFSPRAVLVPTDFSPLADLAVEKARTIAAQFGSKLYLLHAVEPIIQPVEYAIVPREMEEINAQQMKERKTRLESVKEHLEAEGTDCVVEVKLGKPWHTIVEYAKAEKCDLIVLPTHGHTGAKHLFLGSTAERVVQHAPCSVLVVR